MDVNEVFVISVAGERVFPAPLKAVPDCDNLLKPITMFCKLHNIHIINCVHFLS